MHHVVVERWSRQSSPLHRRDARGKLGVLVAFLVAVSTTPPPAQLVFAGYGVMLLAAALASRLPLRGMLARAALVLPFSATFALLTWWAGDPVRALSLAEKSFLSGLAALLLIATTPIPRLLAALDSLRVPRTLVLVIQFLYRYLFVISEQAQHMRLAALSRRGTHGSRRPGMVSAFQAAAGAVGVLFARSWERAGGIYSAMLARGFRGHFTLAEPERFRAADALFLCAAMAMCVSIRLAL
jgi:cobalt/nickel transport system permease protein